MKVDTVKDYAAIHDVQRLVEELTPNAVLVLMRLGPADDFGFRKFAGLAEDLSADKAEIRRACRELRERELAEYGRGLMTDEGEVAGSGYALSDAGVGLKEILSNVNRAEIALSLREHAAAELRATNPV